MAIISIVAFAMVSSVASISVVSVGITGKGEAVGGGVLTASGPSRRHAGRTNPMRISRRMGVNRKRLGTYLYTSVEAYSFTSVLDRPHAPDFVDWVPLFVEFEIRLLHLVCNPAKAKFS
jgi:hypothetical protein